MDLVAIRDGILLLREQGNCSSSKAVINHGLDTGVDKPSLDFYAEYERVGEEYQRRQL